MGAPQPAKRLRTRADNFGDPFCRVRTRLKRNMSVELESAIETPVAESASAPPPPMQVIQMIFSRHISAGISVIARLGVADHLGSEPVQVEQIAREVIARTR